jgi:homoserine kinase type II
MVMLDGSIYELFEFMPGGIYDRSLNATHHAGSVLAAFHEHLAHYVLEWEPSRRGYHDAQPVRANLNGVPASIGKDDSVVGKESELLSTVSSLYDAYEAAAERVNAAGYYDWPVQIVHADWHPGNMLFQDGRVSAVIDYDSLHLLPPITDVANGALQFSILGGPIDPTRWPAELDERRFQAFISGYDSYQRDLPLFRPGDSANRHDAKPGAKKVTVSPEPPGLEVLPSLMVEALIAEAVLPIAATGSFGRMEGFRFLQMVNRKVHWLEQNGERLLALLRPLSA